MASISERHRQVVGASGRLRASKVARLEAELDAIRARAAEIEQKLDIVPAWQPGETVAPGDRREHDGTVYTAVQGHTTQADWHPPAVPAPWQPE